MPTLEAPQLDGQELLAPSFTQAHYLYAPQHDGQIGRGATLLHPSVAEVVLTVGGVVIDSAFARSFEEQLADTGSFSFQMFRVDFLASSVAFDDEVVFTLNGVPRFGGLIPNLDHVALAQGEEVDQVVTISGLGRLGEFRRFRVQPSRGVGALPIEDVRSYSWVSTDYSATGSGWPYAKVVNSVRSYAGTGAPRPHVYPNIAGKWIWANVPGVTATDAPQGICLFRDVLTLADIRVVRFFVGGDNVLRQWVDAAEITWFAGSAIARYFDIELGAGGHVIAAKVANKTDVPGEDNPAGYIGAAYTLTPDGLLDELIWETDSNTRCLPYPVRAPGFTVGRVLRLLMTEAGMTNWTRDFTDLVDSAGNPWTYQREINLNVGRSGLDAVRELMDAHADIAAGPGRRLRAWNRGGRGRVTSVTLQQTTDPATSDFLALRHQGVATLFNRALIRYSDGYTTVEDAASIAALGGDPLGVREEYFELGHITDEDVAKEMVLALMENRAYPEYSTIATLHPSSAASTPFDAFEVGDWVDCLDENDGTSSKRVASIVWSEDENGAVDWPVTLGDIQLEVEERHAVALQRMAMGYAVGGARISSRAGTPAPTAQQVTVLKVAEFSFDNTQIETGLWPKRPAEQSGNIVEVYGQLTTAGSTTTTVVVTKNGSTIATLTFPAGETEDSVAVDIEPVRANVDKLQCDCTAAGTGAAGLDVQVRAI